LNLDVGATHGRCYDIHHVAIATFETYADSATNRLFVVTDLVSEFEFPLLNHLLTGMNVFIQSSLTRRVNIMTTTVGCTHV